MRRSRLRLSRDETGGPHGDGQPKLICEPYSLALVYDQSIVGMCVAGRNGSCHYLSCSWKKIAHPLAERVAKPDVAPGVDSDAGDMRACAGSRGEAGAVIDDKTRARCGSRIEFAKIALESPAVPDVALGVYGNQVGTRHVYRLFGYLN